MSLTTVKNGTIWKPKKGETEQAKKASEALDTIYRDVIAQNGDSRSFFKKVSRTHLSIPSTVILWMLQVLREVASGNAVTLIPIHAELTTQEGADFLNVSRPFFVNLLDQGKIRHKKVGRHRRVLFADLYEYKIKSEAKREKALRHMTAQSQNLEGDDFDLKDLKD